MKKDLIKILTDKSYNKPPIRKNPTNNKVHNHIDGIWSSDLADMIDYKIPNYKEFRYIFEIIVNFSKYTWCILLKTKNGETITKQFSKILTKLKRKTS